MNRETSGETKISTLLANFEVASGAGLSLIFNDPASLRTLNDQCEDRSSAYNAAYRLLSNIPRTAKLCILIDFDVLLAYIRNQSAGSVDIFELQFFFEQSLFPYRIPQGTLEELANHLRRDGFFEMRPEHTLEESATRVEAYFRTYDGDENGPQIPELQIEKYERLAAVLGNPRRVRETESTFDDEEYESSLDAVNRYSAGKYGERSLNNQRDAKNLASVIHCARTMASEKVSNQWYLLLSATDSVHQAGYDLSTVFAAGHRLTVTTWLLAMMEVLGYDKKQPDVARAHAQTFRKSFRRLADVVTNQLDRLEQPDDVADTTEVAIEAVEDLFRRTLRQVATKEAARIEQKRSAVFGVSTVCLGRQSESVSRNSFIKTLDGLRKILDDIKLIRYRNIPDRAMSNYRRFRVLEAEAVSLTDEPLCNIAFFEHPQHPGFWEATWRLDESEGALIAFMAKHQELISPAFYGELEPKDANPILEPKEEFEHRNAIIARIVVKMPDAVLALPTSWIVKQPNANFLRHAQLQRLAMKLANEQTDEQRRTRLFSSLEFGLHIESIQLNFNQLCIEFECEPTERKTFRICRVRGASNDADLLASIYSVLGSRVIMETAFREELRSVFQQQADGSKRCVPVS